MVTIVDYGLGNLGSIKNMLKKIGVESCISSDIDVIATAEKLILPGVGSFDTGMKNIEELNLLPILNKRVLEDEIPVLGICLGMQLMTKNSEEGILPGLGWIDAETRKFILPEGGKRYTIPHMGWEYVTQKKESNLIQQQTESAKFYFVHAYYVSCSSENNVLLEAEYIHPFVAAFEHKNIIGVQFHPEKSHSYGMKMLKNFIENY